MSAAFSAELYASRATPSLTSRSRQAAVAASDLSPVAGSLYANPLTSA